MPTRNQITAFLTLSVAFWIALLVWRGVPVTREMLLPFSTVVSAVSLVLLLFDRWAWHWIVFRGWLIKRPYMDGTWRAELVSDWVVPTTGSVVAPVEGFMVVRQTASTLSLRLFTRESRSDTVSAGIEVCPDGTFEINCAYRNRPKGAHRPRSEIHYGALLLHADSAAPGRLEGDYWTDRKTLGSMVLSERIRDHCASFDDAHVRFDDQGA